MRIAIIGYGYWGPNLLRNFAEMRCAEVTRWADQRTDRRALAQRRYPSIKVTDNVDDMFNADDVDAVVVATPVSSHFSLAKRALEKGKHVLVEKPMTRSVAEGEELVALAKNQGLVLMVDHTFIYTGAVRRMKETVSSGELGDLYYFDSVRINLGLFQHDTNVLWDLAPHDLSILTQLIAEQMEVLYPGLFTRRLKARQSVTARTLTLTRLRRGFGGQPLSLGKGEGKSPRPACGERIKVRGSSLRKSS